MEIKTYRAASMHEALALVRRELGPDAAVEDTREDRGKRWFGLNPGARQREVTASTEVNVASRIPRRAHPAASAPRAATPAPAAASVAAPAPAVGDDVRGQLSELQAMVQELYRRSRTGGQHDLPESLFRVFTDLIDADLTESLAREYVERVRSEVAGPELNDPVLLKARIARLIEAEIRVSGPISITPGRRRLVALVGPTGVGKTTTIAKLAANYRLRERRHVGLITVDTYRIAAVEQLRTYADIIDLPMQVVSSPREMREAVRRLDGLDLILMDTAGRSPRDEIKIQELKAFLSEAGADDVFLVLSSVTGARMLEQTAQQFAAAGVTGLILTKLDEASSLGNLVPLVRSSRLPLAYLTNGQNVPDDIELARADRLAASILAMNHHAVK